MNGIAFLPILLHNKRQLGIYFSKKKRGKTPEILDIVCKQGKKYNAGIR